MVACNPTLGLRHLCVLASLHGRFLLRILLPAQQELQTGGCGMALPQRERTLYKSEKERQLLLNHERDFFTGTALSERDSIKDVIRYWERNGEFDKTYLYFNPSEEYHRAAERASSLSRRRFT